MPRLSETTHVDIRQVIGKRARAGRGLGKRLQGMLKPIVVLQKKDRFRLGYKPDKNGRRRFAEKKKEKWMSNFLGKEREEVKIEIPPLRASFVSEGFINSKMIQGKERVIDVEKAFGSLSIDMVEVEGHETKNPRLPPFLRGQVLNN
ncbi:hypothetical protein CRYUN_Cryun14cG0063400 [Craigia yunnanensis]